VTAIGPRRAPLRPAPLSPGTASAATGSVDPQTGSPNRLTNATTHAEPGGTGIALRVGGRPWKPTMFDRDTGLHPDPTVDPADRGRQPARPGRGGATVIVDNSGALSTRDSG
jgi:hypothetical protein